MKPIQLDDLINSEGYILRVMQTITRTRRHPELFLEATFGEGNKVYCRTNPYCVYLLLVSRLSIKELYLLRQDSPFFVRLNKKLQKRAYSPQFYKEVLSQIEYGDEWYHNVPTTMRINIDAETYVKQLMQICRL